jgi:hypothetical protein
MRHRLAHRIDSGLDGLVHGVIRRFVLGGLFGHGLIGLAGGRRFVFGLLSEHRHAARPDE